MKPIVYVDDSQVIGKFYVYELWNPLTNLPFYVGKGKDNRFIHHFKTQYKRTNFHKINTIHKIISADSQVIVKIVYRTDVENLAFDKEIELIDKYGRVDKKTGILTNLTDGGEGTGGYIPTTEFRKIRSTLYKGDGNPMYGKNHTDDSITQISTTRTERFKSGDIIPTKHSEEWKQYLRDNNPSAKIVDEELIVKLNSKGCNVPEIHNLTGITIRIIRKRLSKLNLSNNSKKEYNVDMTKVIEMKNNNLSYPDIAKLLNIPYQVLNRRLRKTKYE